MQEFPMNRRIFISRCCFNFRCVLVFEGVTIERPVVLMLNVMVERGTDLQ
jgi:hypothetical protein